MDADMKLVIQINNKKDIALTDLTISLLNVSQQFTRFLIKNGADLDKNRSTLFVRSVTSGSIIIDLKPICEYALPLLSEFNTVAEFVLYLKEYFSYFLGKSEKKPTSIEIKDMEQFEKILEPIAKDNGSSYNFIAQEGAEQVNYFLISSAEANAAQNAIKREIANATEKFKQLYDKQLLRWYQIRFSETQNQVGDKGIIESITKTPLKVIFADQNIKNEMINTSKFSKQWQDLAYIVDVEVGTIENIPKLYKIINYYPEETFDPED